MFEYFQGPQIHKITKQNFKHVLIYNKYSNLVHKVSIVVYMIKMYLFWDDFQYVVS